MMLELYDILKIIIYVPQGVYVWSNKFLAKNYLHGIINESYDMPKEKCSFFQQRVCMRPRIFC